MATGCTDALPTRTGLVGIWCCRRKDEHHSASVLSLFIRSRFAAIHDPIASKQSDTRLWSASDSDGQQIPRIWVSSAYAWVISPWSFTSCSTSATYKTNRIGLRTDPCGTPYKTNNEVNFDAGVRTYWLRPVRYPSQWQLHEGRMTSAAAGEERRGRHYKMLQNNPAASVVRCCRYPVHVECRPPP